ncbi:MAG: molybdopterin-guanine dinucleotide biosynthesis protein A [Glaciecola sp.]|jgi:molybdopterin-guanine dinucleotide biosynthesis protein A
MNLSPYGKKSGKKTIGVVLAGGRSSRMGKDKALLQIDSDSMITRTRRTLEKTSTAKVFVSRNDGNEEHMADLIPNKGPLSGIHSMALRFPNCNLLVVPVDLPLLDANTLQELIDNGEQNQSNVRFETDNLPLFINNTPHFRQALDYTLKFAECLSVGKFCSQLPLVELENSVASKMFNANTPEQWQFAMQQFANNPTTNKPIEKMYESFK